MTRVRIDLATESDNEQLLRLMAAMPMPGPVRMTYQREPSFFGALCVEGKRSQVVVGRDSERGHVVGLGIRSTKLAYINGTASSLGYLSSLRLEKGYRHSIYLARAYQRLRELHKEGQTQIYLSTVVEGNAAARSFTAGRGSLPAYHDLGLIHSLAILPRRRSRLRKPALGDVDIRPATRCDIPQLVSFLNRVGGRRQFFPAYSQSDFDSADGLLRGIVPENICVACRGGRIVGSVALWDQQSFRQSVVAGYAPWLAAARPLCNTYALIRGLPKLPGVGATLNYAYLSLVCVQNDSHDVFAALVEKVSDLGFGKYDFLVAGMHGKDPLLPVLRRKRHRDYVSRLHVVCWQDGERVVDGLDGRVPYIEVGAL